MSNFVHLNLHTEFSIVDGLNKFKSLMPALEFNDMPAVAMTDQNNLMGMVQFYLKAHDAGVKPIFGMTVRCEDDKQNEFEMTLLAMNDTGLSNLIELSSRSYLEGQRFDTPYVHKNWLTLEGCEGIICLSGAHLGEIGKCILNRKDASELASYWSSIFPKRFYLELQRIGVEREDEYISAAIQLAGKLALPVVATNAVRFLHESDFEAHEVRTAIHDGYVLADPKRPKRFTPAQYLKTPEQMMEVFSDLPEALLNSVEIAKRCNVHLSLWKNVLPQFPIPQGMTEDEYFRQVSHEGLCGRLEQIFPDEDLRVEKAPKYRNRLDVELDVIINMGFPGYFLIVMDFIRWAKKHDIPVGPGRGSGAGSLVAYALDITDLDPLEYDLLFERFLNPERVSMPDFDIDFCMEGRDKVIEYVAQAYGRQAVSQIITFGTMAAKAVVRDVGRVLGHGYGFVDGVAKLIPPDLGMTLTKALEVEPELKARYEEDEEVSALLDMALKLEGTIRNAGKHAGGVVIAPNKLTDFSPLYCEEGGHNVVTQLDKNDVEAAGLVKFDFLGLRTLTIIDWAVQTINARHKAQGKPVLDISDIPLKDEASFQLMKRAETTAVFQLESAGMKDLIRRLQPDCFEDIIALVALFRPGPLGSGMVDDFINRKKGKAPISYPHPQYQHACLEESLKPTYGIILYQEQVMQIAQIMGGYSLGGADLLRRAMGKKKPEEMEKQRGLFLEGAAKQGYDKALAGPIFDLMEKFAGYGFNKSHSAAYALVAYQTLYLKAHYGAEFMAATMSADMDTTDKIVFLIDECKLMNIHVRQPNVNESQYKFTVADNGEMIYGLGAIKGVGQAPAEAIAQAASEQPFTDLNDFCMRIPTDKANRRVIEALILSGAMDVFGVTRHALFNHLPSAIQAADQARANEAAGAMDMFSFEDAPAAVQGVEIQNKAEWDDQTKFEGELQTLGQYYTGHPIRTYLDELSKVTSHPLDKLFHKVLEEAKNTPEPTESSARKQYPQTPVKIAGMIGSVRTRLNKQGEKEGFVMLDDSTAKVEIRIFAEDFRLNEGLLRKDNLLIVEGRASYDDFNSSVRIRYSSMKGIDAVRAEKMRFVEIRLDYQFTAQKLLALLSPHRAAEGEGVRVMVKYLGHGLKGALVLGEQWHVLPTQHFEKEMKQALGEDAYVFKY